MPSRWVMFDLEDADGGVIRCTMWPSTFAEYGQLVAPDAIVMARGRIDRRGGEEANLNIDELMTLSDVDERSTSGIEIRFDERNHGPETVKKAYEIIRGYPANGDKPGALRMQVDRRPEHRRSAREQVPPQHYEGTGKPPCRSARARPSAAAEIAAQTIRRSPAEAAVSKSGSAVIN